MDARPVRVSRRGRRGWLAAGASLAAAGVAPASLAAALQARARSRRLDSPYGPLAPVADRTTGLELLSLPPGFSYASFGWSGDAMADGQPTPPHHDGMAVIAGRDTPLGRELVLVRNHERGLVSDPLRAPGGGYDEAVDPHGRSPGGGTTTLLWRDGQWREARASLAGTMINCAGGPTPWATWLSCEETLDDRSALVDARGRQGRRHGYVFEVAPLQAARVPQPLVHLGRFRHEAAAVDPRSGTVYLTEDTPGVSGFYRFLPATGGAVGLAASGRLQIARLAGTGGADRLLVPQPGDTHALEWLDIESPDADPVRLPANVWPGQSEPLLAAGCTLEGLYRGAARMSRGEGLWYAGERLYAVDTAAGIGPDGQPGQGRGAVWELHLAEQRLRCIFATPPDAPAVGNHADNITVSPRGGILVFEDGGTHRDRGREIGTRILGIQPGAGSYALAENHLTASVLGAARAAGKRVSAAAAARGARDAEFCGGCFSPDGTVLFVNLYSPGITLAISGPWSDGPL